MDKLKEVTRRCTAFVAAVGFLGGIASAMLPALASADALNPLTERTLLLSSSAPGFQNTDGANNAFGNGVTTSYAPPNSGANGRKTGETFTFRTSTAGTDSGAIKAFTFQYCTNAAGLCQAPGDDSGGDQWPGDSGGDTTSNRGDDVLTGTSPTSDLNVATSSPTEIASIASLGTDSIPDPDGTEGNFAVEYSTDGGTTWNLSSGWEMSASNLEDSSTIRTGKNNYITVTATGAGATGITQPANTKIRVIFYGTNDNYITNPGKDAFFVKINDYAATTNLNFRANYPNLGEPQNVVDGGVTVANVMNQSIAIHTKVLETLEFSVGTYDPDTGDGSHAACDAIQYGHNNSASGDDSVITLGNPEAENSLAVGNAYDAWSFWRLSSNSSNGATVYYSGHTLADTENDTISGIYDLASGTNGAGDNSAGYSHPGSEQFGLGLDVVYDTGDSMYKDVYNDPGHGLGATPPKLSTSWSTMLSSHSGDPDWFNPRLYPLVPDGADVPTSENNPNGTKSYGLATGPLITDGQSGSTTVDAARFAFSKDANTIPQKIASESTQVVNCSTGLMRYIGNIAATTAAGIYTTKINYLAAPEY